MISPQSLTLSAIMPFAIASAANAQWTMTNLHPVGSSSSYALSVNAGKVMGYAYLPNPARQSAGMWTAGTAASWLELAPAPAVSTISFGHFIGNGGSQQGGQWVPVGSTNGRACWWNSTAASFTDLHPTTGGFIRSSVACITPGQQWGWVQDSAFRARASVWSGTAASRVDFHPAAAYSSVINASDGTRQVGFVTFAAGGVANACVWNGSANNAFNYHPSGAYSSTVFALHQGTGGGQELVGQYTVGPNVNDGRACLWTISPEGNVMVYSLHTENINAQASVAHAVHGGVQVGTVTINNLTRASVWFGHANTREDPLPNLPLGTTQTEARGVYTTPTTITVVGFINRADGNWNAVMWTKPNTPPPCSPADIGSAGGLPGSDGSLDNNDFIVFINRFFEQSATADVGSAGGLPGSDGLFDNNDFIVFINQFFDGAANC